MSTPNGTSQVERPQIDAEHAGEQQYVIYDRSNFDAWIQSDHHVDRFERR